MSVLGLGVDIVEIDRMKAALERRPRMKERIFSEEERWYCEHRSRPEVHYALRFAAKEAVLKALGTGFRGIGFTDVEVVREPSGRPVPRLSGKAAERAAELGVVEMHLSLSFTHSTAVASAVAITEDARPKKDEKVDPKAELAAQFKQMRSMLDGPIEPVADAHDESSMDMAHADDAPADDVPADDAPADDAPADDAPADDAPADDAPADGAPADGAPADDALADGTSHDEAPTDGAASGNTE